MNESVETGVTKRFRDHPPDRPLGKRVDRFSVGRHECGRALKQERLARDETHRRWKIARREEAQRVRLEAYRRWLRKELVRKATAHQEARLIREFLAALEVEKGRVGREEPDLAWLAWARDEADRLDPLTNEERISQALTPPDGWIPDDPGVGRIGRGQ